MSLKTSASVVTEYVSMDPKDKYVIDGQALSTASEDVGEGIQSPENDTNSLQSLSHLDPPADSVYMICGVLIAMVLVGVIIVLLAVTISKLRKREDSQHHQPNQVHPEQVQCPPINMMAPDAASTQSSCNNNNSVGIVNRAMSSSTTTVDSCCNDKSAASTIVAAALENAAGTTMVYTTNTGAAEQFIWQFPPPYPPPNTPPPQYTLYNDQDTLVHGLQSADRQGFGKSFRKNLGGRWRRLVKRKPENESCAIPPELKDQLKTIYVY
ncbi:uncharacterized protein LOC131668249 isoform X2 [Phymastichus coffea]|uniref:uncharacterized protein LOC131668249 isoform X2 n=1 Tax=Phymastichus coffea TaxID=108790 RepID=UPI00273C2860|nr:uncharacterized protein LOC131668249 isoform X2 [Phymastichus coffea]